MGYVSYPRTMGENYDHQTVQIAHQLLDNIGTLTVEDIALSLASLERIDMSKLPAGLRSQVFHTLSALRDKLMRKKYQRLKAQIDQQLALEELIHKQQQAQWVKMQADHDEWLSETWQHHSHHIANRINQMLYQLQKTQLSAQNTISMISLGQNDNIVVLHHANDDWISERLPTLNHHHQIKATQALLSGNLVIDHQPIQSTSPQSTSSWHLDVRDIYMLSQQAKLSSTAFQTDIAHLGMQTVRHLLANGQEIAARRVVACFHDYPSDAYSDPIVSSLKNLAQLVYRSAEKIDTDSLKHHSKIDPDFLLWYYLLMGNEHAIKSQYKQRFMLDPYIQAQVGLIYGISSHNIFPARDKISSLQQKHIEKNGYPSSTPLILANICLEIITVKVASIIVYVVGYKHDFDVSELSNKLRDYHDGSEHHSHQWAYILLKTNTRECTVPERYQDNTYRLLMAACMYYIYFKDNSYVLFNDHKYHLVYDIDNDYKLYHERILNHCDCHVLDYGLFRP